MTNKDDCKKQVLQAQQPVMSYLLWKRIEMKELVVLSLAAEEASPVSSWLQIRLQTFSFWLSAEGNGASVYSERQRIWIDNGPRSGRLPAQLLKNQSIEGFVLMSSSNFTMNDRFRCLPGSQSSKQLHFDASRAPPN